jgi:antitoxin component YwqK of YwqJK toxin-antitoxin module
MTESPREPEKVGKIFTDKNGKKYNGKYFYRIPDVNEITGFIATELNYLDGKLHGSPAISYPDGQQEEWKNGNFVKILRFPFDGNINVR